jgi:carbon-monoxide dehydrogenase small subunit
MKRKLELKVNNELWEIEVEPDKTLLEVIREDLGLKGAKEGCGLGACGACTVIIDGAPVLSCLTLAVEAENRSITTIEGLAKDGQPDPIQLAFVDHFAMQCGFCTPGMIMSAKGLLDKNQTPSREEIKEALSGNLCRCTGYKKIIDAVESVVRNEKTYLQNGRQE